MTIFRYKAALPIAILVLVTACNRTDDTKASAEQGPYISSDYDDPTTDIELNAALNAASAPSGIDPAVLGAQINAAADRYQADQAQLEQWQRDEQLREINEKLDDIKQAQDMDRLQQQLGQMDKQ